VYNLLVEGCLINNPDQPERTLCDSGNVFDYSMKEEVERRVRQEEREKLREGILLKRGAAAGAAGEASAAPAGGDAEAAGPGAKRKRGAGGKKKGALSGAEKAALELRRQEDEVLGSDALLPSRAPPLAVQGRIMPIFTNFFEKVRATPHASDASAKKELAAAPATDADKAERAGGAGERANNLLLLVRAGRANNLLLLVRADGPTTPPFCARAPTSSFSFASGAGWRSGRARQQPPSLARNLLLLRATSSLARVRSRGAPTTSFLCARFARPRFARPFCVLASLAPSLAPSLALFVCSPSPSFSSRSS
jgi:hypothetical protein